MIKKNKLMDCTYQESVAYSKSFPFVEKTIKATSASQSTEISWAFFNKPDLLFEKVTCLLILFSILFSWILPLPILYTKFTQSIQHERDQKSFILFLLYNFLVELSRKQALLLFYILGKRSYTDVCVGGRETLHTKRKRKVRKLLWDRRGKRHEWF